LLRPREFGKRDQFSFTCQVGAATKGIQPRSNVHYGMAGIVGRAEDADGDRERGRRLERGGDGDFPNEAILA
jgi:hypothetical protein